MKESVHVVEECIYDRFYQVKVCTRRDADCAECLQISCRPCLRPVDKWISSDRLGTREQLVKFTVLPLRVHISRSTHNVIGRDRVRHRRHRRFDIACMN